MSDQLELYSNVERKRELVERLEKILTQQLDATEVLDNKAWELLKISSATFGIVATLEITLTGSNVNSLFWQALGIILLCYVAQTVLIILVVRPRKWGLVPGVPDGKPLFNTLLPKYMAEYDEQTGSYKFKDESRYLDQLLTDYLGREDPTNAKIVQEGAIATAQRHNEQKARLLVWASGLLATIVIGLIIMAIISVASL